MLAGYSDEFVLKGPEPVAGVVYGLELGLGEPAVVHPFGVSDFVSQFHGGSEGLPALVAKHGGEVLAKAGSCGLVDELDLLEDLEVLLSLLVCAVYLVDDDFDLPKLREFLARVW